MPGSNPETGPEGTVVSGSSGPAAHLQRRPSTCSVLQRPVREARLVFADVFGAQPVAGMRNGERDSEGNENEHDRLNFEGVLIDQLLQAQKRGAKDEIVAMGYDNVVPMDNDSECDAHAARASLAASTASANEIAAATAAILRRRPGYMKWVITVIASVLVALQCAGMLFAEAYLAERKFELVWWLYKIHPSIALGLFLAYGLSAALASALLVLYVSPRAASSGIPDMKAYLNGNYIPGFLTARTWFARTAGLILTTSAGLFSGSEGPLISHLGAIVASGIARGRFQFCGRRFRLPWKMTGHRAQCEFVSLGAAIGVAGAFGSPVGGVLFSFEEASSFWPSELTWRTFFGCAVCTALAKATKHGFQSFPAESVTEFPDVKADFSPWELVPFALMGVVCGLAGALFCYSCRILGTKRAKFFTKDKPRIRIRIAEVLGMASFILLTCALGTFAWGCKKMELGVEADDRFYVGGMAQAHCPDGEYSDLGTLVLQPKHRAIKALFTQQFEGGGYFDAFPLIFTYSLVFVCTLMSSGMAMPFGLFVPHIFAGACLGRGVGQLMRRIFPAADIHLGVYALVGASGQLAGITRMTVSLTMIMVEITNNMRLMLPLMLCIMVTKFIADAIVPSAFNVAIELNAKIRMLVGDWQEAANAITLMDVCSTEVIVLHARERLTRIATVLDKVPFQVFPLVTGAEARVVGVISRSKLVEAVARHRRKPPSGDAESESVVRLSPFADMTPEVKHFQTPVPRALNHFQSMGLHYLCVIGHDHGLKGIITRSDLAKLCSRRGRAALASEWSSDTEAKPRISPHDVPKHMLLSHQRRLFSPNAGRSPRSWDSGSSSGEGSGDSPHASARSSRSFPAKAQNSGPGSPRCLEPPNRRPGQTPSDLTRTSTEPSRPRAERGSGASTEESSHQRQRRSKSIGSSLAVSIGGHRSSTEPLMLPNAVFAPSQSQARRWSNASNLLDTLREAEQERKDGAATASSFRTASTPAFSVAQLAGSSGRPATVDFQVGALPGAMIPGAGSEVGDADTFSENEAGDAAAYPIVIHQVPQDEPVSPTMVMPDSVSAVAEIAEPGSVPAIIIHASSPRLGPSSDEPDMLLTTPPKTPQESSDAVWPEVIHPPRSSSKESIAAVVERMGSSSPSSSKDTIRASAPPAEAPVEAPAPAAAPPPPPLELEEASPASAPGSLADTE